MDTPNPRIIRSLIQITLLFHVLICPLGANSKLAQFQRILLGISFSNLAGGACSWTWGSLFPVIPLAN